jgi:hypothetical protein
MIVGKYIGLAKILKKHQNFRKESLSLYERKQHKPWFDKECSEFDDQRKQAKMQWLQDSSQINADKLNNVGREIGSISGTKKGILER